MKRVNVLSTLGWGAAAFAMVGIPERYGVLNIPSSKGELAQWAELGLFIGLALIAPLRVRWALLAGGALASMLNILSVGHTHGGSLWLQVLTAPVWTLIGILLAQLTRRLCGGTPQLGRVRDLVVVLLLCGVCGGAFFGSWAIVDAEISYPGQSIRNLPIFIWLAATSSVVLPLLLLCVGEAWRHGLRRRPTQYAASLGAIALMMFVCLVVFRQRVDDWRAVALPLLPLGVLALSAMMIGPRTTAAVAAVMGVCVAILTGEKSGPFPAILPRMSDYNIASSVYVTLSSSIAMLIAAAMSERRRLATEVEAARQRLELAVVGSGIGIWDWDVINNRSRWEGGLPQLLGNEKQADEEGFWRDRLHPDDRERVLERLNAHIERSEAYDVEYRMRTRDGTYRWFRSRGRAIRDRAGRATRMCGTLVDVNERVTAEQRLRESEARYRLLTEHSQDFIIQFDREGRRLYRSPATERVFGFSDEERTSIDPKLRVHPEDHGVAVAGHAAALRGEPSRFELRAIAGGGGVRWVDMLVAPIADEHGRFETYVCYGRDITELKAAEAQARQAEERYRAFVAQSAEAIWRFDLEESIDTSLRAEEQIALMYRHAVLGECNDAMAAMYGHKAAAEFVGARLGDLMPREDPRSHEFLSEMIRSAYRLVDGESHEVDRDGRPRIFLNNLVGIVEEGRLTRVWGTQRDITAQRHSERLRDEQNTVLKSIAGDTPLQQVLDELVRSVQRQSEGVLGSIILLDPDGVTMRRGAAPDLPREVADLVNGLKIGPEMGSCGRAMFIRQGVVVSDIATDPLWKDCRESAVKHGLRACWSEPIVGSDGGMIGSFAMYYRSVRSPSEWETQLIQSTARLAAIAIERARAAQAIRDAEQRYRAIFEQASVGIIRSGAEGKYTDVNPGFCKMVGRTREELIGITSDLVTHPDDVVASVELARRAIDSGESGYTCEKRYVRPDGTAVQVVINATILRDRAGALEGFICVVQDVSERKRVEVQLERFFSLSLGMLCIADTDGFFRRVNPAFTATLGYTESELRGRPYVEFVHPDDREATLAEAAKLAGGGNVSGFENRYRHSDGTYRLFEWRASLVTEAGYVYAAARDITEERAAAEAIRRSEAKYRRIVETAEEGVWVVDKEWRTSFVNARMAAMLGYPPEKMLGRHINDFADEIGRAEADPHMQLREQGVSAQHDFRFKHADGHDVWTMISANAITDDEGVFVGALAMVTDISARRAAEEALRKSQETNAAILAAIPDLLFRVDSKGRYLDYAGPEDAPLLVERERFLGRTVSDVLPPARAEQCMRHLNVAFATGQTQTYEYESGHPEDSTRSWEVRVFKVSDDEALLLVRNITDRRRTEIALRQAEEKYRSLVERLPLIVYIAPMGDSEPTYVSPQFRDITGLPPERLLGGRELYQKHIHADDRGRVAETLGRADRSGAAETVEYRLVRPDGREVWLREQVVTASDGKGRPASVHGLILDITAAKRAEEALRDNQRRLALLVSQAPFAVIVWNTRFDITQWNPAAERIFGFTAEEAIGRNAEIIVPPSAKSFVDGVWRQLLSRRGGSHAVNENITKQGRSIICEWSNSPLLGPDGAVVGVSSFVQDVTERVNSERRQALMMRELDHRVKNNMAAVLSLAEQTGRTAKGFEEFHETFTGRVRALSRLHTALASSHWNGADFREILQQAVEPYSGNDPERLSMSGPAVVLPPRVAQSLTMAFNELATNAFKYGSLSRPDGRIVVTWTAEGPEAKPTSLSVSWSERGGPTVSYPERRGFGMDLIEGAITYQLRGSVTFDFAPEGFSVQLVAPLGLDEPPPEDAPLRQPLRLAENPL